MFDKLGIAWGNSLLALIAIIFLPAPYLFYVYGPWLRSKSRAISGSAAVPPAAAAAGTVAPKGA